MKGRKPRDGMDVYYASVVALLRASFVRVSETKQAHTDHGRSSSLSSADEETNFVSPTLPLPTPGTSPASAWRPCTSKDTNRTASGEPQPLHLDPVEANFQLVDIACIADFAFILFRWQEAGEDIFVTVINLSEFAKRDLAASMVETIVVTNVLEDLGKQWFLYRPLTHISGLTFLT
ncbi:MAG: hypothetical protein IVW57_03985 [Ktedonobacterales bacterium]|nr:hypothetical protein [Ktedonobacterales bacterium]